MRIKSLTVKNYRNLDTLYVSLDGACNFIVGENNLGKSNLLTLLNILFTSKSFQYDDFTDLTKPIEIEFQLALIPVEIGHFQDLFDVDDYSLINIIAEQQSPDDNITFSHKETSTYISPAQIRSLNFVHYNSLRNPLNEINFTSSKGIGKFLRHIISAHLDEKGITDAEFLDVNKMSDLLTAINSKVAKIKAFKDFDIKATADENKENLLSKIVVFNDSKGDNLGKTGYGVQFLLLITLSILEKLYAINEFRGEKGIFVEEATGKKTISLVLGLDEPEIHLHPYMQRALVKYLGMLVNNKDSAFSSLVKELFDIDEFTGQVIIVTHSPNIILNDYKQIIRFYQQGGTTKIISGNTLNLNEQLTKHLHIHFPFIKEAFFSRCAIFVEGATEISSLPGFAAQMGLDFDELGMCVIQAGGDAVKQLMDIAAAFAIPSVGINDRDNKTGACPVPGLFWTDKKDFEEEMMDLIDSGKESVLRQIVVDYDSKGIERELAPEALNKRAFKKYQLVSAAFTQSLTLRDIALTDSVNLKAWYVTWFGINKCYPLGILVGESFTVAEVPAIYQTLITEAKNLV